jgi:acylphosphatase
VIRRRVVVRGAVQGVGFRWSCVREAGRLGVAGWVRNLPTGEVEIVAEGDDDAVGRLVAWARRGPSGARVDGVDVREEPPEGEWGFRVRG